MNGGGGNRPFSVNNGFNIISRFPGSSDAMGGLPGGYLIRNVGPDQRNAVADAAERSGS